MVKKSGNGGIILIDFDWAGVIGEVCVKFIYWQVFSELRLQCAETEAAVSGDGGSGKWRWRQR
jgi:hypothetical protein